MIKRRIVKIFRKTETVTADIVVQFQPQEGVI